MSAAPPAPGRHEPQSAPATAKLTATEAVAAAFGPAVKPDPKGTFIWTVARTQPLPPQEGLGDVRGRQVRASVLLLAALPQGPGAAAPAAPRWLLVTAGPTLRDGQPDDCHGCGTVVSAFVFARAPDGAWIATAAAPVLTVDGSFGDPPDVAVVATGPARRALRLSSGYTGQGFTGEWQSYYAVAPGFAALIDRPLTVHGDNEGTCSDDPAERARDTFLAPCRSADTRVRFVPGQPGETDDPGQWVLEATTRNPRGLTDEGVLPAGVRRLPFRHGQYHLPPATP